MLYNGEYERTVGTDWDGEEHEGWIEAEDNGQNVTIKVCHDGTFVDHPALLYTYKVADYTINVRHYCDCIGYDEDLEYYYNFGEYEADEEGYPDIQEFVYENIDEWTGAPWALVEYIKWDDTAVFNEIYSLLNYDSYLLVDGAYKGEFEPNEAVNGEVFSKEEMAKILAKEIEIDEYGGIRKRY